MSTSPADLTLWYETPAVTWTEALPLGNGRLGAMLFGGPDHEHIQLNEDTLWSGGPYTQDHDDALPALPEVRRLIFAGRYAEAEALANDRLMGRPLKQMSFQPAGNLDLRQALAGEVSDYRRSLDLDAALAHVGFTAGGVRFEREMFISAAHGVLALRLRADKAGALDVTLALSSLQPGTSDGLSFRGRNRAENGIDGALAFIIAARLRHDGTGMAEPDRVRIAGASDIVVLLDIATSFRRYDDVSGDPEVTARTRLDAAAVLGWDQLLAAHLDAHRALFRRFAIDLGPSSPAPTSARIGTAEPALAALFVQFGRYLMICSSRPGTQPANLQGLWNDLVEPPWGSKYTSNINLEMNYWPAMSANLAECAEPLIRLVEDMAVTGAATARRHYNARGWVMHHNTDLWRAAAPVDGAQWGLWPMCGAWLAAQLLDLYSYSGDDAMLGRIYPLLRGAAEFFVDTLVPHPVTGELVMAPSLSPENVHPFGATICAGPAMDSQLLRDLFRGTADASDRVRQDSEFAAILRQLAGQLPPDRIGQGGQLQEWFDDWDLAAPEPEHRHVSHLYALYPSHQISPDTTAMLAAAARRSLDLRGDDATGWGLAWRINLWARLRDGERAHKLLARLLSPERTYPNLFDAHPPFQIDGNFGGAAGILEMLVQSGPGWLHMLPALPAAWPAGELRGLRARGGLELDLAWREGRVSILRLRAPRAATIGLRGVPGIDRVVLEAWRWTDVL